VRGAAAIARTGGRVLVQDRESSVVWGMPGSVLEAGVPATTLPLDDIAPRIRHLCSTAP
jgi:two-component system chemotaxis response regulator CheB